MTIKHTSTDDNRGTGDGAIYWFDISGWTFGLCSGAVDDDGHVFPGFWVDEDGQPLDFPEEHIPPADMRAAAEMVAETPPPATSAVLDDYDALCKASR